MGTPERISQLGCQCEVGVHEQDQHEGHHVGYRSEVIRKRAGENGQLASRYDLPADTASKVYDYKETAEAAVKQLREDNSLTSEQRQAALQKISDEAERTLKATLGEKTYNRYRDQGGWWLRNLAPRPQKQKTPVASING